ncbi:MAG: RnfH family protein [Alcaligenaceae bacterium]|nr:RnfH family protein [Alcaligenaceae bacterium]
MATLKPSQTLLNITVCWSSDQQVLQQALAVPPGTCVGRALELLGQPLAQEGALVGIFGQRCALSRVLQEGDRIELYRPLIVEPKAARRRRAIHREKVRNIKKKMPINDLTV